MDSSSQPEKPEGEDQSITAAVPPADRQCGFNPNASFGIGAHVFDRAGVGDLPAMRALVEISLEEALSKPDDDPYALACASEALVFARLCASRRVSGDVRKLAAALCVTSDRTRRVGFVNVADALMGEAVAILERLADEGDELATFASCRLAATNAAVVEIARTVLLQTREIA